MASAIILARSLSTDNFAAFSYFQITVTMIATYSALGLGVTASRYFAEIGHENSSKRPPPIGALYASSVFFAVVSFIIIFFVPKELLTAGFSIPPLLMGVCVFILVISVVPSGAILGIECYRQAAVVSALSGSVSLSCAYLASQMKDPLIGMIGITIAAGVQFLGESKVVISKIGYGNLKKYSVLKRSDIRKVLSFAGPMVLVSLMAASGSWILGKIILNGSNGEYEFSLYIIGLQWFSLGLFLPGMISRVLLPRLIRSKNTDARLAVRQAGLFSLLAAVSIAVIGVIFGSYISAIYGDVLAINRWFVSAYLISAIVSAPANTIGNAIIANDGQAAWLLLISLWFVTLIISAYSFAGLGAWSGAIAHALSSSVLVFLAYVYSKKIKII